MKWLTALLAAPAVRQAALALLAALAGAAIGPQLGAQLHDAPPPAVPVLDGQHLGLSAS